MIKYLPLLEPGFHDIPFDELKKILQKLCVTPFTELRREHLLEHLFAMFTVVKQAGIFTEMRIDGSFLTAKESPKDIDLVLFYEAPYSLSPNAVLLYSQLRNSQYIMTRYNGDLYLVKDNDKRSRRYWVYWFGHFRDDREKGIIRVYF